MASAVLGNAARRLGGSALRQMQAAGTFPTKLSPAVELGQQRFMPRFIHTEQQQACSTCGKPGKDGLLGKIQGAKEELYDLMTEANKTHGPGDDKKLFQCLSGHVRPRHHDPTWESNMLWRRVDAFFRGVTITNTVAWTGGLCAFSGVTMVEWMRS